jgi:hypothetical protein
MLAGIDELGCGVVPIPNVPAPAVMQIDPTTGLPTWGPGGVGGPTTLATALAAGVLTVTVNGISAVVRLRGDVVEDAFGQNLGFLLSFSEEVANGM